MIRQIIISQSTFTLPTEDGDDIIQILIDPKTIFLRINLNNYQKCLYIVGHERFPIVEFSQFRSDDSIERHISTGTAFLHARMISMKNLSFTRYILVDCEVIQDVSHQSGIDHPVKVIYEHLTETESYGIDSRYGSYCMLTDVCGEKYTLWMCAIFQWLCEVVKDTPCVRIPELDCEFHLDSDIIVHGSSKHIFAFGSSVEVRGRIRNLWTHATRISITDGAEVGVIHAPTQSTITVTGKVEYISIGGKQVNVFALSGTKVIEYGVVPWNSPVCI